MLGTVLAGAEGKWRLHPAPLSLALSAQQADTGLRDMDVQGINQEQVRVEKHCTVGGDIGRDGNKKLVGKLLKRTIKGRDGGWERDGREKVTLKAGNGAAVCCDQQGVPSAQIGRWEGHIQV